MKLIRLVKRGGSVLLYFENAEPMKIAYETAVKFELRKGEDVTDEVLKKLAYADRLYKIKNSAFRLLSRRAHSVFELKRKLLVKFEEPAAVDSVISELIERGYLDDEKFAVEFALSRLERKKIGINKLKADLKSRGIKREIVETVIDRFRSEENQFGNALEAAKKKLPAIVSKEESVQKRKIKLVAFLQSRGFDYDVIREIVERLIKG